MALRSILLRLFELASSRKCSSSREGRLVHRWVNEMIEALEQTSGTRFAPLANGEKRRGRGAVSRRSGRFEAQTREKLEDGWDSFEDGVERLATHFHVEKPRTIITRNDSPDISFDRSINPYRGCEHGCVYCFARPTHAYLGLSPGLDFETEIFVKDGAAQLLERELSAPGYTPKTIAIGSNTDPYQPAEKRHRIMRSILEVLARANHPVGIVTKSALVTRDIDLLAPMAEKGLVKVALSVTTLDRKLAQLMEPRAAAPELRLQTIETLSGAGIPVAVMVAPVIPAINDDEIEKILTRARAAGAEEAGYILLRLPLELRDLYSEWLLAHFPDRARRALGLVRSTRDGKLYDSAFGRRMKGDGPYAWMIGRRFEVAAQRLGFGRSSKLRVDLFTPPSAGPQQLKLF
jgi:DNA repair photolyase